jgi:hypothetical protein
VNIRDIENLHAQYAPQPVVIDLTGQVAAIPALAAPVSGEGPRASIRWPRLRFSKRVTIVGAAAALTLGGGMGAARLWVALGRTGAAHVVPVAQTHAPSSPAPVNAAPARPLSASDLAVTGEPQIGMASVDPRELLRQTAKPAESARVADAPAIQAAATDEARAIASPIHAAHHEPVQAASTITPPPAPQSVAPVQKPQPVMEPAAVEHPQVQVPSPAPAATHHLHRVVAHASAAKTDTPPQPDQDKPAAPARSGDVQLF